MKKFLPLPVFALFAFFALLAGCAKSVPEFVPISLNWYSFEGDVRAVDSSYKRAALDSLHEERCQISLTRALMNDKKVQSLPDTAREFNIQSFGVLDGGQTFAEYRGKCKSLSDSLDLEREALPLSGGPNCNFTARCDGNGTVEKLKVF